MATRTSSGMTDDPVVYAWATPSNHGSTTYETILRQSGLLTCECPAWVFKRGDSRDCKHIRMYEQEATRILDDIRAGRRPRQTAPPQSLSTPRPTQQLDVTNLSTPQRRMIRFHD